MAAKPLLGAAAEPSAGSAPRGAERSGAGAGDVARRLLTRVRDGVVGVVQRVTRTWQRSLQLRVGTTTVLVTGLVVLVIGLFLVDKVAGGILSAKQDAAISQARIGLQTATTSFADVDASVPADVENARQEVFANLTAGGTNSGAGLFTIAIDSETTTGVDEVPTMPIPASLRTTVRAGNLATQYAPVHPSATSRTLVPGLIVGEPVQARTGVFELYYLFPLTAEEQTVKLIQRTVLIAGFALVVLVLGIALLVTRQVVRPVRVAGATAGQLAAGDLSKRIAVTGSDDIGRLGRSFNDMADSLQRQIRRLEDLSRLQRRFTSDVSHELRTPLTTIRMASEYLYASRDDFGPELARAAELMHDELDRFESLLGDLLEISRHDAGAARLDSAQVDIRTVVADAVDAAAVLAAAHGSEVVIEQPDVPVTVDIDTRRVERILRNLLGNALDHGEGRPVVVTIGHDVDAVAITVRDHGIGLRPGEAALVFNRFWRGDPSRSRLTGGTGLGLAISLEDARLHDGWLQAWGERGRGAQFRLTLPRRAGHTVMHSPLPLDPDETDEPDDAVGPSGPTSPVESCRPGGRPRRARPLGAWFVVTRRARRSLAAAAAAVIALAGCTGVPRSSAPRTVEPVDIGNRGEPVPGGPAAGDDARTVVTGFLDANAIDPVNHDTARKYLAGPERDDWSDRTATIISGRSVSTEEKGVVTVRGRVVGSLSQNGVYVPQLQGTGDGGPVQSFVFRIGATKGQNRIVGLQAGLLLTTEQFGQTYSLHGIYFFDPSRRFLVPDPRWSALDGDRLYGWLAGQLATGPRPDLGNAVMNDTLPSQANARRITATGESPIKVEVPGAAQLDTRGKRLLAAQISATVTDIASDEAVQLTDGGNAVPMPGGASQFSAREAAYAYTSTPPPADVFYLRNGQVVRDTGAPLAGKLRNFTSGLNSIAVSQPTGDGFTVAGVTGIGSASQLVIGTEQDGYRLSTVRGDLSRPAWLPSSPPGTSGPSEVWIGSGGRLVRVVVSGNRASASVVSINAGAGGGRIVSLRLSPEGSRIAMVIEAVNGSRRLFIGSIVRSAGQVRVDALPVISPESVTIDDAGWIGSQKLIAIGSITASGDARIFETGVDGSLWSGRTVGSILPAQPDSISVAVRQLAWVSTGGTVWRQAGRSWSAPGKADPTIGTDPVYLE